MAIGYELIKELGVLSQGRNPVWTAQPTISAPNGAPSLPTDGVALNGAVVALVGVDFGDPAVHAIKVGVFDAATTYTVTIDATPYDVTGEADAPATLGALALLVDADPSATATVEAGRLVVTSAEAVASSVATGTGTIAQADAATAVDIVIWLYSGGAWGAPTNSEISITRNLLERAEVGGAERAYIEIVATDGECTPRIGPCGLEG